MSFFAEVIPPVCWITLCLLYLIFFCTVNEGGPELPCMTAVTIIIIIIIIIVVVIIIIIIIIIILLMNKKKFFCQTCKNGKTRNIWTKANSKKKGY